MPDFIQQLWKRKVVQFCVLYLGTAWLLLQVAIALESTLELPNWLDQATLVLLVIGFPLALILAWAQDSRASPKTGETVAAPSFESALADIASESKTTAPQKSIAVLPFVDMSPEKDQEYFSDGIAEEILNALVCAPQLKVAGRTSSFVFKGRNVDLREIGEVLSVAHILEGSVRKQGNRVRITAQLIRARDGYHMWSDTFDGTLDDIFDLQEAISLKIAEELEALLGANEKTRLATELSTSPEAYELFLKGRALVSEMWGETTLTDAAALLEKAVEIDPQFTEAHLQLAQCYYLLPQYRQVSDEAPYMEKSEASLKRAREIDPNDLRVEFQQVGVAGYHRDYKTIACVTVGVYEKWLESKQADKEIEYGAGYYYSVLGHTSKALKALKSATTNAPTLGVWQLQYANALFASGHLEEAERFALRSDSLGFFGAAARVAYIMAHRGNKRGAIAYWDVSYDRMKQFLGDSVSGEKEWRLYARALWGHSPLLRYVVRRTLLTSARKQTTQVGTSLLSGLLTFGEAELFMKMFEAHKFGNSGYILTLLWDDTEGSLKVRNHPDFLNWCERIGLVAAWNEIGWPDKVKPPTP